MQRRKPNLAERGLLYEATKDVCSKAGADRPGFAGDAYDVARTFLATVPWLHVSAINRIAAQAARRMVELQAMHAQLGTMFIDPDDR